MRSIGNGLFGTRFHAVADNTIDYWMKPDCSWLSDSEVLEAVERAPWLPRSTLQLYLHVGYCAQRCSFCAFSGGNSLDFKSAGEYAKLLVWQMNDLLRRTQACGKPVRSVNIGGGSPDLLKGQIRRILEAVRQAPGVSDDTELSVEFTLSTVPDDFLEALCEYRVTKASFGVQALDPMLRQRLRMPKHPPRLEQVCERLAGRVPVINVDLMTGFPGQTLSSVIGDLGFFMSHPVVNCVSTYLLTPGAAPQLVADMKTGFIGERPPELAQALFRLHSYSTLQQGGWVRRGTNTYVAPHKLDPAALARIAGNECIGARRYEDFLLGCGGQAVSSLPGVRLENVVDTAKWSTLAAKGMHPLATAKCSLSHQRDMALWAFPLAGEGLRCDELEALREAGALTESQEATFTAFCEEGLIVQRGDRYLLTITGEVFMGCLVQCLKTEGDQQVIQEYIEQGNELGSRIAEERLPLANATNNRQIVHRLLSSFQMDGARDV